MENGVREGQGTRLTGGFVLHRVKAEGPGRCTDERVRGSNSCSSKLCTREELVGSGDYWLQERRGRQENGDSSFAIVQMMKHRRGSRLGVGKRRRKFPLCTSWVWRQVDSESPTHWAVVLLGLELEKNKRGLWGPWLYRGSEALPVFHTQGGRRKPEGVWFFSNGRGTSQRKIKRWIYLTPHALENTNDSSEHQDMHGRYFWREGDLDFSICALIFLSSVVVWPFLL